MRIRSRCITSRFHAVLSQLAKGTFRRDALDRTFDGTFVFLSRIAFNGGPKAFTVLLLGPLTLTYVSAKSTPEHVAIQFSQRCRAFH